MAWPWERKKDYDQTPQARLRAAMTATDKALEDELSKEIDMDAFNSLPSHNIVDDRISSYKGSLESMHAARDDLVALIIDAQQRLLKLDLAIEADTHALSILQAGPKPETIASQEDPSGKNTLAPVQPAAAVGLAQDVDPAQDAVELTPSKKQGK